jgi:predicted DNA-binding transcriptional regulator AlpA
MQNASPHRAGHAEASSGPGQSAAAPRDRRRGEDSTTHPPRLLIDTYGLAELLSRSVPSLQRDDAAGRLPAALRLGGSKRWRYSEIVAWVEAGCPDRKTWEALKASGPC